MTKSTSKSSNKFSVYKWCVDRFTHSKKPIEGNQQNNQQNNQQINQQNTNPDYNLNINSEKQQPAEQPANQPTNQPMPNHNQEDINTDKESIDRLIDDRKKIIKFAHKKEGFIEIHESIIFDEFENLGNSKKEISYAIEKMKKFNPELTGTIQAYLLTILKNEKEKLPCKKKQKNNSKIESDKPKEAFLGKDLSETPLAKFARQNGLSKKL